MITKEEAKIIIDWLRIVNFEYGEKEMTDAEIKLKEKLEGMVK